MAGTKIVKLGRLCSNCGKRAYRGDEKCRSCGTKFEEISGAARKVCAACNADFPDSDGDYCPGCRRKIGTTLYYCNSCGAMHDENQNYCSACGGQMAWADHGIKGAVCDHSGNHEYCPTCGIKVDD